MSLRGDADEHCSRVRWGHRPFAAVRQCAEGAGEDLPAVTRRSLADAAALAVMAIVALGAAALVCGVYNAFDDGWFGMSGSTLSRILALAGF
ncbi:hypothetical protein [Variovorax sp. EBFNA2]|uniref:hypothetical protein n=1 Tax=Variovorax sp. EBFNA2 TaxID=3342097 RepID=UPI0029C0C89C|nr:hypothetical protein [Variovorax boronicumulans]WPG40917.1 hypothetical protein RZE79_32975 [Variovorax boronicumulans]